MGVTWCEQLRLLRWALRVDDEIMPLAHFPPLYFTLAMMPDDVAKANRPMLPASDLRAERDTAHAYLARLAAESIVRKSNGLYAPVRQVVRGATQLRRRSVCGFLDWRQDSERS